MEHGRAAAPLVRLLIMHLCLSSTILDLGAIHSALSTFSTSAPNIFSTAVTHPLHIHHIIFPSTAPYYGFSVDISEVPTRTHFVIFVRSSLREHGS